ncbi:Protein ALP1-like [Frankliniella fusca]|uniref:Protein ALP1-like n=1 Tax=Frankliniella fusca TaxID=407009 RepID=A0AAE1LNA0_9NEOP|nr:Protein ALP1-like [Frankliniella fusca]
MTIYLIEKFEYDIGLQGEKSKAVIIICLQYYSLKILTSFEVFTTCRCLRMDADMFEELLQKVTPLIQKQSTHLRQSIPAAERLSLTLRHLATGESQESLSLCFRIGQSTVSGIIKETMGTPDCAPITGTVEKFPFVIVGDEGFTLSDKLLIPYPKGLVTNRKDRRIFNYRLSRARRCSENAFGVIGARFQIYRSPMRYDPDDARDIVMATVCLHNCLRTSSVGRAMYTPANMLDLEDEIGGRVDYGDYREENASGLVGLHNQGGNRHADSALELRDRWCAYFNTVGQVPWQDKMIAI